MAKWRTHSSNNPKTINNFVGHMSSALCQSEHFNFHKNLWSILTDWNHVSNQWIGALGICPLWIVCAKQVACYTWLCIDAAINCITIDSRISFQPPAMWCNLMEFRILIEHAFIKFLRLHPSTYYTFEIVGIGWNIEITNCHQCSMNRSKLRNACACAVNLAADTIVTGCVQQIL